MSRRFRIVVIYLTGQGLTQLLNLLVGFALLRWLNLDNYAQFSVAFGFQVTLSLLTDLGFSGTIVALVGTRGNEADILGAYIRSGRRFRNIMLLCLTPIASIFYIGIARQHHWSTTTSILLFLSVISSIYFTGMGSYYAAPLLIHGRLRTYYRIQTYSALFRILSSALLYLCGGLNAWTASWSNTITFSLIGFLNLRASRDLVRVPREPDPIYTKRMVRFVAPNLPGIIFYSFQGQISLFLISFFGHTQNIAEVSALGRLGQVFLVFSGFNTAVIEPYMARLPENKVAKNFVRIFAIASFLCCLVCLAAFIAPKIFLLLLGAKYKSLYRETGWLVLGSSLSYLTGVAYTMGGARRWVYWLTSWLTIGLILVTQLVFLLLFKINDTIHVIYFGVAAGAAHLLSILINSVYGYIKGPSVEIE
ncbi:hypothetical protein [Granulicella sp. dw_53]|uniref:lipopolysaccharide biosynthesis protein n=1 Tax=Granulicella sp. dw_53 TaxID=2719792 RepID=UPI001BD1F577|nr:hypothetical protein [Granulicella sp. dw_53]